MHALVIPIGLERIVSTEMPWSGFLLSAAATCRSCFITQARRKFCPEQLVWHHYSR